jgi:hypothetical protein
MVSKLHCGLTGSGSLFKAGTYCRFGTCSGTLVFQFLLCLISVWPRNRISSAWRLHFDDTSSYDHRWGHSFSQFVKNWHFSIRQDRLCDSPGLLSKDYEECRLLGSCKNRRFGGIQFLREPHGVTPQETAFFRKVVFNNFMHISARPIHTRYKC